MKNYHSLYIFLRPRNSTKITNQQMALAQTKRNAWHSLRIIQIDCTVEQCRLGNAKEINAN